MGQVYLPSGWKSVRLRDVLKEVDVRAKDLDVLTGESIPVLSLTKNQGLILQTERFDKRIATDDVSKYKVVKKGWIVYNPYVLWEGAIHALRRVECGIVSPVYLVWEAIEANTWFLDYLLRTQPLLNEYLRVASGVVKRRRSVRRTTFLNIEISLPPIFEQCAITRTLQAIQRSIETRRVELRIEHERKHALMRHLFRYGTRGEPRKPTEVGELPKSWRVEHLGDICSISTGTTPATDRPEYYRGDIPFIKTSEIANNRIKEAKAHITSQAVQDYNLKIYPPGSVFLAMYGQGKTRGQVAILDIAATTTQNTAAMIPSSKVNSEYIWLWLMSQYTNLRGAGSQGHISHLNIGYVKRFKIPVPSSNEEQAEIADALNACHAKIVALEREVLALEELFNVMIGDLMTGRLLAVPLIDEVSE